MEDDDDFDFLLQLAAADDARDPKGPPALLVRDDDTILKEAYGGSIDRNEHSRQASQTAASSTSGAIQGNPSRTGVKSHNITQADLLQRPKADSVCTQHVACYKEEISGLRVSRPVVGSLVVRDRLNDSGTFLKLSQISSSGPPAVGNSNGAPQWSTVVILSSKAICESKTGSMYSRWLVTDLVSTATLFLFGQAHKELYKESEGSVLILYNAKCSKDGGNGGYSRSVGTSLTLDKAEQVQRIGASPDLGKCAGVKKDGLPCGMPINRSECEFCIYHAQTALRRLSLNGGRPELQAGGRSYTTKAMAQVAMRGPDLLRPTPKPLAAQRAGSAAGLRDRLHQRADRCGEAVTSRNSFRMMMAVAKQHDDDDAENGGFKQQRPAGGDKTDQFGGAKSKLIAHVKKIRAVQKLQEEEAARLKEARRNEAEEAARRSKDALRRSEAVKRAREVSARLEGGGGDEGEAPCHKISRTTGPPVGQAGDAVTSVPSGLAGAVDAASARGQGIDVEDDELQIIPESEQEGGGIAAAAAAAAAASSASEGVGQIPSSFAPPPEDDDLDIVDDEPQAASEPKQHSHLAGTRPVSVPASKPAATSAKAPASSTSKDLVASSSSQRKHPTTTSSVPVLRTALGPSQATNLSAARGGGNPPAALWKTHSGSKEDAAAAKEANSREAERRRLMAKLNPRQHQSVFPAPAALGGLGAGGMAKQARPATISGPTANRAAGSGGPARSAFEAAFGSLAKTVPESECASRYSTLVADDEFDLLKRMMDEAERKDAIAQKLDSVTKLEVSAWHCPQCDRFSRAFDPACRSHGQTKVQTTKRFWTCCHCNAWFETLGVIFPKGRCPRCNDHSQDFKPATMLRSSSGRGKAAGGGASLLAQREAFLPRGVEHSFSLK